MIAKTSRLLGVAAAATAVCLTAPGAHAEPPPGAATAPQRGPVVLKAQQALNGLGCNAGRQDGRVDLHTRSAIVRFQTRHRLPTSGKLDDGTRRRLFGAFTARCDVRPVPKRSGTGRRIVISQRQNWVWIVGPGGGVRAQAPMTDNPDVLRPGRYATGSHCGRAERIKRNTDGGGLWLPNFVRFAPCGIGFHRIPERMSNGSPIHAGWLNGTNFARSHGCIRLGRAMSQRVWEFTGAVDTTRVVVVRG